MLLWRSRHLPFEPDIGNVLAQHDIETDTLSTSHMLDLSYSSFAALRLPAGLAALALLIAPLSSFLLRMRRRHYVATWVLGLGMALFLVAAHVALGRFGPYLSSKQLAQKIAAQARPQDRVMIYGDQAFRLFLIVLSAAPHRLGRRPHYIHVVRIHVSGCSTHLSQRFRLTARLERVCADLPLCASAPESQG